MDIGRTILNNLKGRQRLDAGTFGTMGVGFGYAIAAQSLYPDKKIVMVVGDSAFGFSGLELETAARYKMPLKVIIINNNGISNGAEEIDQDGDPMGITPMQLTPTAQYEKISEAFGGQGLEVKDHASLQAGLTKMLSDDKMWVMNVRIEPTANRKPQEFYWFQKTEKPKL